MDESMTIYLKERMIFLLSDKPSQDDAYGFYYNPNSSFQDLIKENVTITE